jgi:acyl carrier protein
MNRSTFYSQLEELLELPKESVRGDQSLSQMPEWDSLAVISFIALVDSKYGVILQGKRIEACKTVDDLAVSVEEAQ